MVFAGHKRALGYGYATTTPDEVMNNGVFNEEQEKRPIFNGRSFSRLGLPVSLFCPAFAQLLYDLDHVETRRVVPEILKSTAHLFAAAQQEYTSVEGFRQTMSPILHRIFRITETEISTKFKSTWQDRYVENDGVVLATPSDSQHAIVWNEKWRLTLCEADIPSVYAYRKHLAFNDKVRPEGTFWVFRTHRRV